MSRRVAFIVICTLLIIVAFGFTIYYIQVSDTIKERNIQISQLQDQLTSANNQISSLSDELMSDNDQISSLTSEVTSANDRILSLENELTSVNTQITQLESKIAEKQSDINDLRLLVGLFLSTTEANQAAINQIAGQSTLIVGFLANYSGYVEVSGTSNSTSGYIRVTDTFYEYPFNNYEYEFGMGNTLRVPILPGTVRVYFGNKNTTDPATATITVKYVY